MSVAELMRLSEQLADEGAEIAASKAGEEWADHAFSALMHYPRESFMTEELRTWAHARGLPHPPDGRAWGAVINRARRAGYIESGGYRKTVQPVSHARPASVWKKVDQTKETKEETNRNK
jgi:hypothetical protein